MKSVDLLVKELGPDAVRILAALADFDPYDLDSELDLPLPMFFADGWQEVLALLGKKAARALA